MDLNDHYIKEIGIEHHLCDLDIDGVCVFELQLSKAQWLCYLHEETFSFPNL